MLRLTYWAGIALVLSFGVFDQHTFADTLTVPTANATMEGDSNNYFPFSIAGVSSSMRYQQAYSASAFAATGGPIEITQLAFRPDGYGDGFSVTLDQIQLNLSTTSRPLFDLSTTFADNVGADDTIVYNGSLTLASNFTGPADGPKAFDVIINLTTPFHYDWSKGNLLLDLRNNSAVSGALLDAVGETSTEGVNRLWSNSVSSSTSLTNPVNYPAGGLVTQFTFSGISDPAGNTPAAVPLPSAAWGTLSLLTIFGLRRPFRRGIVSQA